MQKMNILDWIAMVLVIVGGINWGLVGFFKYNLVDGVFGVESMISRVVYGLVGLSALWMVYTAMKMSNKN